MKKLSLFFLLAGTLLKISATAQGVGIGTTTPKAAFNVAENKTVLFGRDTIGGGGKMMWIPSKYAFRAGVIGNLPVYNGNPADGNIWDYDSIGLFSFAAGYQNKASSAGSIAIGALNQSSGITAIALGQSNIVSGLYSFSAGVNNVTSGSASTTIGSQNKTYNDNATAIGRYNIAKGEGSTAIGYGAQANSYVSIALGLYNDTIAGCNPRSWVNNDPLLTVGAGIDVATRKNAMTILKNGKTGFGTNTPLGLLHSKYNSSHGNPQLMLEENGDDYARLTFKNQNLGYWDVEGYTRQLMQDNDLARLNFYYSTTGYIFSLRGNGNAVLTGTLFQNSDERLKKNIVPLKNTLNKLSQLNAYTYQWKDTSRGNEEQLGLLAQEVEKQFPQLVMTDEKGKKSVAYANMVPILMTAIKEQQDQIEELRKLVTAKIEVK